MRVNPGMVKNEDFSGLGYTLVAYQSTRGEQDGCREPLWAVSSVFVVLSFAVPDPRRSPS